MHVHRHMDVICVRTQIFLIMILNIQNRFLEFLRMYAKIFHVSIKDLRICANNPVLEDFVIRNHYKEFLRMYAKIFHVSIKDLRICANNPVLEDSVIQSHY